MAYQLGIPDALRRFGVPVEVVPGWERRGRVSLVPGGVTCHWTAGPRGARGRPSLNVVVHGRPSLSGPLCNVYFDRNGVAVVVAAGTANHAGRGNWRGLFGNHRVFGIEAESAGDLDGSDWTTAQRENYPKVAAALQWLTGNPDPQMVHGHNEWTTAKIDIRDWPMPLMRQQVAALLQGGSPLGGFLMALSDSEQSEILEIVRDLRPGKEGRWHDGPGFRMIREVRNAVADMHPRVNHLHEQYRVGTPGRWHDGETFSFFKRLGIRLSTVLPGVSGVGHQGDHWPAINAAITSRGTGDIDVAALAELIAAKLPDDIAKQFVDELSNRLEA
ncbi:N-acetylmuramoyl-L-alanine amidase [Aeromicrobium phragmitis]|uniref:N-acetylmuramoyl-L-alanine amidase n=1 Tax=Aeromicrobium phragmitis TaxID=2478914 RepID=A0A3L8PHR8_9ACTN|nr:N-acetylmuramoyl-L-alanine amidase [Aeromicrobium phragmitis]RLV54837.1 N-acetylmuramoyl-L-alanine amidase [Aeromicrobium phragmitis]